MLKIHRYTRKPSRISQSEPFPLANVHSPSHSWCFSVPPSSAKNFRLPGPDPRVKFPKNNLLTSTINYNRALRLSKVYKLTYEILRTNFFSPSLIVLPSFFTYPNQLLTQIPKNSMETKPNWKRSSLSLTSNYSAIRIILSEKDKSLSKTN